MKLGGDDREEAQTAAKGATRTPLTPFRSLVCHPTTLHLPAAGTPLGKQMALNWVSGVGLTLGAHVSALHWGHTSRSDTGGTRLGLTLGAHVSV